MNTNPTTTIKTRLATSPLGGPKLATTNAAPPFCLTASEILEQFARKCGNGLHLSPTPELALIYHQGPVKKCRVHMDDFVVYPLDITKVRCRRVEVTEESKAENAEATL